MPLRRPIRAFPDGSAGILQGFSVLLGFIRSESDRGDNYTEIVVAIRGFPEGSTDSLGGWPTRFPPRLASANRLSCYLRNGWAAEGSIEVTWSQHQCHRLETAVPLFLSPWASFREKGQWVSPVSTGAFIFQDKEHQSRWGPRGKPRCYGRRQPTRASAAGFF